MRLRHSLLLTPALLGIVGCPTRSKYDQTPAVRITSPTIETTYTNGTVRITAAIDPVLDLPIVLLENSTPLAILTPPSYSYDWPTAAVPEGDHTIVAEVALSSMTARSEPVTIVVDRTPPTVLRTPAPGAKNVMLRSPIQAAFSEPVLMSQPLADTFTLSILGGSSVATHTTLDAQSRTATIAIDDLSGLSLPTMLHGTIAATISDRAGNPLTVPSGDWGWEVPDFVKLPPTPLCRSLPPLNHLPVFAVGSNLKPVLALDGSVVVTAQVHCQLQLSTIRRQQWSPVGPPSSDGRLGNARRDIGPGSRRSASPRAGGQGTAPDPGEIDVSSWSGTAWQARSPIVPQPGVFFPVVYPVVRIGQGDAPVLLWGAGPLADRYFMARQTPTGWNADFGVIPVSSQQPFDGPHFDMILDERDNPISAGSIRQAKDMFPCGTGSA